MKKLIVLLALAVSAAVLLAPYGKTDVVRTGSGQTTGGGGGGVQATNTIDPVRFQTDANNGCTIASGGITCNNGGLNHFAEAGGGSPRINGNSSVTFGITSSANGVGTTDVGLARAAAGVWKTVADAGSGTSWMQQSAARVRLAADYTNATAAFTNTALSITVINGRKYSFQAHLFFDDSTAADGAQFDFNGGSATSTDFRAHCTATNAAGAALTQSNAATTALATANSVTLALTTQSWLDCAGSFEPSSNGTFIIRAAQAAHTTGTLTVRRGSHVWFEDMP